MLTNNQLSKRKIFIILGLFILLLTGFRMVWMMFYTMPNHPEAKKGIIDFQSWVFTNDQTITLDGEWEFYPNQFLVPCSINDSNINVTPMFISVPDHWNKSITDQDIMPNQGFGTYRLQILLPEDTEQLYGIRVPEIAVASKIYIDGKLIAESGQPGESASQYEGKIGPYSAIFQTDHNDIEMIIHVANYETAYMGGIIKSIKIGKEPAISQESSLSRWLQIIVCIILLLHGLYAFGLYIIGKQQKELIYFSLLLVFAALSILLDEDKILFSWFPIDIKWSLKLTYLSFAGVLFFMLKFIESVFSLKSRIFHLFFTLYYILALLTLFIPLQYIMYVGFTIMFLNAMSYLLMFVCLLRIIRKGDTDAIFLLLSNTANFINILWGIAINTSWIEISYYPYDFMIAIIVFSFFLFKRHILIFNENLDRADKLQKADKTRDDFLANTSHELRNPLHSVINIAQNVLDDETNILTKNNKQNLELLISVGRRMTYTLNDLLDVTNLKEKNVQLHKQNINMHAVASGVFDMIRFMIEGKNIQLHLDIPDHFPKVYADENRVVQILFNLLHNAVKYTDEGHIMMYASYEKGMATVSIKDTGIGMDEKMQERIFQPYEQANASMTSIGGGIGLGLSICKQLIELHDGALTVHSTLGEGSIFSFTLPLMDVFEEEIVGGLEAAVSIDDALSLEIMDAEPITHTSLATPSKGRARIVIVDDDPINLIVLSNMLSAEYDIVTATSGKEALIQIGKGEWDLVISDVMMPHMSGYELTHRIRESFSISELPIILLTARGQREDIHTAFRSGANDYIMKPMEALELKARVKALTVLKQSINKQLRMEAAWLQAQIQPHFIFNTLNSIVSLSYTNTERMVKLLGEFGNFLRGSFSVSNAESIIPIEDELNLIRSYLFIEKERFGNRLQIKWEVDHQLTWEIPPLSIQPIVENAVRHGVLKRASGGTVCIQITDHSTYLNIAIVDDGVGMDQDKLEKIRHGQQDELSGIGLANTDRRLKQRYGEGLQIISTPNQGTTVRFKIPILKN